MAVVETNARRDDSVLRSRRTGMVLFCAALIAVSSDHETGNADLNPLAASEAKAAQIIPPALAKKSGDMIMTASNASVTYNLLSETAKGSRMKSAAESSKYWYGTLGELKVIKQLGNTANAKLVYEMAQTRPWFSLAEMRCVDRLWYAESKFNEKEDGGIPQAKPASKMKAAQKPGENYQKDPTPQIRWGYMYIEKPKRSGGGGYGTPCNAYSFFIASGKRGY